jgi:PqqD family protein of HPr-rel-A system
MSNQFRRLPGFPLHFQSWGTEHAVYHQGSGNTHLLDEYGFAVLQVLQNGPADMQQIAQLCADTLEIELEPAFIEHIQNVIRQLSKHDLVEICPNENE